MCIRDRSYTVFFSTTLNSAMSAISWIGQPRTFPLAEGVPFHSQSRKITSVRKFFEENEKNIVEQNALLILFDRVWDKTAKAVALSKCTVSQVAIELVISHIIIRTWKNLGHDRLQLQMLTPFKKMYCGDTFISFTKENNTLLYQNSVLLWRKMIFL